MYLRQKTKKICTHRRVHLTRLSRRTRLEDLERDIDRLAEEESMMTRYEHSLEVA